MADKSDISSKPGSSGWHIALERTTADGHYLGDPAVVESIVRHFIAGVVTRYGHVSDGDMAGADAAAADRAECERLGRVFAGQDDDYVAVGDWNGAGLADALRADMDERMSGDAELDDLAAITEGLAVIAHAVYDVLRAMPVGRGEVDEASRGKLEAIVRYAAGTLSGGMA
jgi:hypothetical protein